MHLPKGPLADSYPGAVVLVLAALTPYLVVTTASFALDDMVAADTGLGETGIQLTTGMANAAYAFGAVIGLQLAVRLPVRRVLLGLALLFIAGSVLAAWAPVAGFHVAGRVLQGLATGGMLIAAVPPLVIGWPAKRLPTTAMIMDLGIFGAVALGPAVGGAAAGTGTWRPFFWIVAGLGLVALVFALLTYEDQPPQDPDAPVDVVGLGLAGIGTAAVFFGVSFIAGRHLISVPVLLPALAGLVLLAGAFLWEARVREPLMPVAQLGHTLPVGGILIACFAGGASVALVQLAQTGLQGAGLGPWATGALFWSFFGGAVVAAAVFGASVFRRWLPLLAPLGLLLLAGGGVLFLGAWTDHRGAVVVGAALVGLGTGLSVAPGLFLAGFSLRSKQLPRVFALIELLRGVAAFLVGPLLIHLAQTAGGSAVSDGRAATWVAAGLPVVALVLVAAVYLLGGLRLHTPRVDAWLAQEDAALHSPPLLARLRGGVSPETPTTMRED